MVGRPVRARKCGPGPEPAARGRGAGRVRAARAPCTCRGSASASPQPQSRLTGRWPRHASGRRPPCWATSDRPMAQAMWPRPATSSPGAQPSPRPWFVPASAGRRRVPSRGRPRPRRRLAGAALVPVGVLPPGRWSMRHARAVAGGAGTADRAGGGRRPARALEYRAQAKAASQPAVLLREVAGPTGAPLKALTAAMQQYLRCCPRRWGLREDSCRGHPSGRCLSCDSAFRRAGQSAVEVGVENGAESSAGAAGVPTGGLGRRGVEQAGCSGRR